MGKADNATKLVHLPADAVLRLTVVSRCQEGKRPGFDFWMMMVYPHVCEYPKRRNAFTPVRPARLAGVLVSGCEFVRGCEGQSINPRLQIGSAD
jgi:hypothetical protein